MGKLVVAYEFNYFSTAKVVLCNVRQLASHIPRLYSVGIAIANCSKAGESMIRRVVKVPSKGN